MTSPPFIQGRIRKRARVFVSMPEVYRYLRVDERRCVMVTRGGARVRRRGPLGAKKEARSIGAHFDGTAQAS